ncbi:PI-PLC domain-containing protein [Pedobacter insulae]|uniref:Alkaline phosphatase n=1 Tax=Pedobacter insulae TaxID=414048 RepID=A0A1I2VJ14_9SPHI|nr:hypothetical protein [Pedobacter insulae]SFG89093.1 alkaline phosphatase [Pedobacter insulae]
MKKLAGFTLGLMLSLASFAQIKIHSHNDYTHAKPLLQAYAYQVYEIEVDIFLIGDSLIVAHSKKDKDLTRTINAMYLDPIANWTKDDAKRGVKTNYGFRLMIDLKDSWSDVYPVLRREIEKYGKLFDKGKDKNAIQIVMSGNRPADSLYHKFPSWVYFDGLPNINYAKADLKRVTMISDNFAAYSKWKGVGEIPAADKLKLKKVIDQAHRLNKPMRFWGAPDTQECWQQLADLGADIINTDKIVECKTYFEHK